MRSIAIIRNRLNLEGLKNLLVWVTLSASISCAWTGDGVREPGFFDVKERLARLSGPDGQIEVFSRTVDFEAYWSVWTGAKADLSH